MEKVKVNILSPSDYTELFQQNIHSFNSASFNELNRDKVDEVIYLGFEKNNKTRTGLCLGIKDRKARSPFSSPFGGLALTRANLSIEHFNDAISGLLEFSQKNNWKSIQITLPPAFYEESASNKQLNTLFRYGFSISSIELNHSYDLRKYDSNYISQLTSDGRRNLKIAQKSNLDFFKCKSQEEIIEAYEVIKINRREKGFPLHLSLQDILNTSKTMPIEFFLVKDKEKKAIASAIVFHPTNKVTQVVYWGDLMAYSQNRSMYFLAQNLFSFYAKSKDILDIGPSTEKGTPNIGLCNFKENIGCDTHPKFVLQREF